MVPATVRGLLSSAFLLRFCAAVSRCYQLAARADRRWVFAFTKDRTDGFWRTCLLFIRETNRHAQKTGSKPSEAALIRRGGTKTPIIAAALAPSCDLAALIPTTPPRCSEMCRSSADGSGDQSLRARESFVSAFIKAYFLLHAPFVSLHGRIAAVAIPCCDRQFRHVCPRGGLRRGGGCGMMSEGRDDACGNSPSERTTQASEWTAF